MDRPNRNSKTNIFRTFPSQNVDFDKFFAKNEFFSSFFFRLVQIV